MRNGVNVRVVFRSPRRKASDTGRRVGGPPGRCAQAVRTWLGDFSATRRYQPSGEVDLAFCNGVFHHIPPPERRGAVDYVYQSLRPGGVFAFFENNPWNPGTRLVMRRIPFDRDAKTLTAPESKCLLRARGFELLHTDFLFFFPRLLSWARKAEPSLSSVPLGAQYLVLGRKPA